MPTREEKIHSTTALYIYLSTDGMPAWLTCKRIAFLSCKEW